METVKEGIKGFNAFSVKYDVTGSAMFLSNING